MSENMAAPEADEYDFEIVARDTIPAPDTNLSQSVQQQIDSIRQWLQPSYYMSPGNEFAKHLNAYVPNTGDWARESDAFSAWAACTDSATAQGCLHIRGVAGSGKSVFAASTIRQLQEADPAVPVLFFFFRQIVEKNHSAKYLVRDFASQLLPYSTSLVSDLGAMSKAHGVAGSELDKLWDAIVRSLGGFDQAYCIIDALDEMDDEYFDFVQQLVQLGSRKPHAIKVLMTSRPLPHIDEALRHPEVLQLKFDSSLIQPDVAKYVTARLECLEPRLGKVNEESVKNAICMRAQGLFIYARFVTDTVIEGLSTSHYTEATLLNDLENLPSNLRNVYEDMLREHARRSGISTEQQARILTCVTFSTRPLRLIELGSLVARMPGNDNDLKKGKELVRASCGRLLEILEDDTVSIIHHSFTEFLHDATRGSSGDTFPVLTPEAAHGMLAIILLEYLNSCPLFPTYVDPEGESDYETFDDPGEMTDITDGRRQQLQDGKAEHPLLDLALGNLLHHLNQTVGNTDAVSAALEEHFVPGKPAWGLMMMRFWDGRFCGSFNRLHLAASLDFPFYCFERLLASEKSRDAKLIDARDGEGRTPLSYAAEEGKTQVVRILLNCDADAKSDCRNGLTPLHYAAKKGHAAVMKLLLDAGVDPLIEKTKPSIYDKEHFYTSDIGDTALQYGLRGDDPEVVAALIPHIPPGDFDKSLHMVCKPINIHAILQTGKANVDSFQDGVTKLYKAAERHEFETMEILLKYGADVNKRCSLEEIRCCFDDAETVLELDEVSTRKGPTPLHAFAGRDKQEFIHDSDQETKRNAEKCFALLLKHGASVNETADGENHANMTPLHYAVRKDRDPTMFVAAGNINKFNQVLSKLLLDAGAELSARNGNQNTPLHIANPADPELVSFLIERGADIRAKNDAGRTPLLEMLRGLYWAKPNVRTMEVLSGHGQDCAATDNQGNNMFHYVFHELGKFTEEFIPIFRSALQGSGDAINKRNKNEQPPFLNYKSSSISSYSQKPRGQEELLQEFIRGGMDLNVRDNRGQTILWRLIHEFEFPAKMETFKLLIRLGADPKIHAGDGSTLLHAAQKWRLKTEWLHLLVSFGVNCLSCDANGNNLIHCLFANITNDRITEDNLHSFHTLLELGVPATAKNRSGETVINILASVESCETFARSGWLSHVLQADIFRGLNVNESNDKGIAPIHSAAGCSEYNVQILLEAGADPTLLTDDGLSPLHVAAYNKQSNVVGLLLEWYQDHGLLDRYINLPDKSNGCTPLHYACRCRQVESIWYLLRHGADVRLRDKVGEDALTIITALDKADYDVIKQYLPGVSGRLSVMDYSSGPVDMEDILKGRLDLLDHFTCDIKDQELEPLTASDEDVPGNHTMLSRVCSRRHPSLHIIQALVDKSGLNATTINNAYASQTRLSRSIPVHKLAGGDYFWQVEALRYFLSHGVDTEAKTPHGDTLLVMALKSPGFWKEKVVRVLLEYKASSQAVESETGKNCLALSSSAALTKMLLAHGAKVENQKAILGSAITELDAVMARALLEAGADPNYIDEAAKTEWQTPESYELSVSPETQDRPVEFSNGRLRQFWDFREQQANEMNMARYALHDAARAVSKEVPPISWEQHRDDLVRVLLEKGADPWATYPNGDTVVHRVIHDKGLVAPLLDAPGCDINCRGQSGQTLLLSACRPVIAPCPLIPSSTRLLPCPLVNTNAIHELLDRNVDVFMTDDLKRTALHLMLTLNRRFDDAHQKAFNALLERGGQKLVLATDSTDVSPLHLALASGQLEAVECLLVNGANVFSCDPRTGDTALHRVACRLVGESGAATEAAALWKHLISHDLDVNARNHVGDTPALAYSRVNLKGTRDPKQRKSHPSYAMQHDTTHCAALALLVDSGADLMAVNYEGQGMLHLTAARRIGELDCEGRDQIKDVEDFFEKLLELGLDPRLEDRALRTPIDMAVARNRRGILQIFTPKGRNRLEEKAMKRAEKDADDDDHDDDGDED